VVEEIKQLMESKSTNIDSLKAELKALRLELAELRKVQAGLKESEVKYRLMVDLALEGIWLIDAQARTVFINKAMAEMLGCSVEEMLGRSLYDFMDEAAKKEAEWYFKRRRRGVHEFHDFRFKRKDGNDLWTILSTAPIFSEEGEFSGALAMAIDITQRKHYEETLEANEERYALAARAGKVGVWDFNLAEEEGYVDPNCKALLGYGDAEISDNLRAWLELVHPEDRRRVEESLDAYIEGRSPEPTSEHRMLHRDGSIRWVLVRGSLIRDNEGRPRRLIGTAVDITERKQLEAMLYQAQRMEALGTLVAGLFHEINNPLNLIMFNIPIIQKVWSDVLPVLRERAALEPGKNFGGLSFELIEENLAQLLTDMDLAADRMAETIKNLKDFTKKSSFADKKPVQVNTAVHNALRLAQTTIGKSGVKVEPDLAENPPMIHGNLQNLEQVVLNLLINSVQAIDHDHGLIKIKTHWDEQEQQVVLVVEDNGKGVDPGLADRIFDPFVSDKLSQGGTGLGLSVTYGLVQAHGGRISFRSRPEGGTIFTVSFPIEVKPQPAKILVVDDEKPIRSMLTYALARHRAHTIEEAAGGIEACIKLGSFRPDLVILDVFMPDMDGVEVCRVIRENPELAGTKVVIITGYPEHPKIKELKELGFKDILYKPVEISMFVGVVEAILRADQT